MDQKDHILLGHAPSKCIDGVNCFLIEKIVSIQSLTNFQRDTFDYMSTKYSDLTILKLNKGQEFNSMGIYYKEFLNRFTERGKITQKHLQWCAIEMERLLHKPYVNEVTMNGQNLYQKL